MALARRKVGLDWFTTPVGVASTPGVAHTDLLKEHGITISMSRTGKSLGQCRL